MATNSVLVCDGTFMENYNGVKLTLLVAVMKTGENHLLPFAVSIVQEKAMRTGRECSRKWGLLTGGGWWWFPMGTRG